MNVETLKKHAETFLENHPTDIKKRSGAKPISDVLRKQRIGYAMNFKERGYAYSDILKQINAKDAEMHWGEISLSQLKKDMAKAYDCYSEFDQREKLNILIGEKEAEIATLEKLAQNLVVELEQEKIREEGKKLTVGQIANVSTMILEIRKTIYKLRGWEMAPTLVHINNTQNNILEIYDNANAYLSGLSPVQRKRLSDAVGEIFEPSAEQDRPILDAAVDGESECVANAESVGKDIY